MPAEVIAPQITPVSVSNVVSPSIEIGVDTPATSDGSTLLLGTTPAQRSGVPATQPSAHVVLPPAHASTSPAMQWHVKSASLPSEPSLPWPEGCVAEQPTTSRTMADVPR